MGTDRSAEAAIAEIQKVAAQLALQVGARFVADENKRRIYINYYQRSQQATQAA